MFKPGDLVKVKENADKIDGDAWWANELNIYRGGTFHIKDKLQHKLYILEECKASKVVNHCGDRYPKEYDNYWQFDENWLEEVIEVNIEEFEVMKLFLGG